MTLAAERIEAIAGRLFAAFESATQLSPLAATEPGFDVDAAYAVLRTLHHRRIAQGWRAIGRKVGFTNRTIWPRYGVYRPMWSHVWDRTVSFARDGEATLSLGGLMQPRIEPEVVFKLREPLPAGTDPERLLGAIEWIAPGFEIVHSVFPDWKFSAADCTAAFGLHGHLVVGTPVAVTASNRERLAGVLPLFKLTLRKAGTVIDTGVGANVLDSPINALAHLRDVLATQPQFPPLSAGEIVTTGTITDAWPVSSGEAWTSDYGDLGLAGITLAFSR